MPEIPNQNYILDKFKPRDCGGVIMSHPRSPLWFNVEKFRTSEIGNIFFPRFFQITHTISKNLCVGAKKLKCLKLFRVFCDFSQIWSSNIYISKDGGHTYSNITSKIQGEYIRRKNGVMTATADSERVVLIVNNHPLGYSDSSTIYVTKDKGNFKLQN